MIHVGDRNLAQHSKTDPSNLKAARYLDMPGIATVNLSMFGTRVGYYAGDAGSYRGVIIDDRLLTQLIVGMFDLLWDRSEVV